MQTIRTATLLTLLGLVGGVATTPAQQPTATFPSEVEMVTVDAMVVDAVGRPVPGLTRGDFVVKEDGQSREIVSFEAFAPETSEAAPIAPSVVTSNEAPRPRAGRAFAFILDDIGMTLGDAADARRAVSTLVERSLQHGDEVILGTTSGEVWWSARIPEGREDLLALAARVKGRGHEPSMSFDYMLEYEAFFIDNHGVNTPIGQRVITRWEKANVCDPRGGSCEALVRARATSMEGARRLRTRITLDTMRRAIAALAQVRGRKSLLLLSRGFLQDSGTEARDVAAASREANTVVYFIDVHGLAALPGLPSAADAAQPQDPLESSGMAFETSVLDSAGVQTLAGDTGGFSVRNTNDLAAGAERVAAESRVFYLLGFPPAPGKPPGEWRKLSVEVTRKDLTVRARRGYGLRTAALQTEARPGKSGTKALSPAVAGALDSAQHAAGIPLRAMAYVFEPRPKDTSRVVVAVELDARGLTFQPSGKGRVARLQLSGATHRDSGRTLRSDGLVEMRMAEGESPGWRSLAREFDLPAGVSQARVVVRDPASSALGAVSHRFEVPPSGPCDSRRRSSPTGWTAGPAPGAAPGPPWPFIACSGPRGSCTASSRSSAPPGTPGRPGQGWPPASSCGGLTDG